MVGMQGGTGGTGGNKICGNAKNCLLWLIEPTGPEHLDLERRYILSHFYRKWRRDGPYKNELEKHLEKKNV